MSRHRPLAAFAALAFALTLGARPALAQEEAAEAPAEKPAETEAPPPKAKPVLYDKAVPADLPGLKPPPAKPEAKADCPSDEPGKTLAGCAENYKTLAEGYRQALDGIRAWMNEMSGQASAVAERETKLQAQIQENEAQITKLKFEGSKAAKAKVKELDRDTKKLWKDLDALGREKTKLCKDMARGAGQKVKEFAADLAARLKDASSKE